MNGEPKTLQEQFDQYRESKGWRDDSPHWREFTRKDRFVILMPDGRELRGVLECDDVGFDGEDEFPVWVFQLEDGSKIALADAEKWRLE